MARYKLRPDAAVISNDGDALGSKVRNVDVLHLLYTTSGLKKSNEFTQRVRNNAVTVRLDEDVQIRIMHPLAPCTAPPHP
jgi:hypothetical protein